MSAAMTQFTSPSDPDPMSSSSDSNAGSRRRDAIRSEVQIDQRETSLVSQLSGQYHGGHRVTIIDD
jgi:hypothetical protein